jgi:hypothetical protein
MDKKFKQERKRLVEEAEARILNDLNFLMRVRAQDEIYRALNNKEL